MSRRAIATALAALLCAASAGAQPTASDVEEARRHYARGLQLYEQHADAAALAELERAYQLAPNWKVLYELGIVELELHDFAAALRSFEQYLDEGKDAVGSERRREVESRIARLRGEVATIEIATAEGATLSVDDMTVGTAPLAKPLVVNPGHHKIGATREGRVAESRLVSVTGGDHARVELVVPEPPPPAPPPPAPAPKEPDVALPPPLAPHEEPLPPRPPPYPLWAGWTAAGALAIGAIATGAAALSANAELTRAKDDGPSSSATLGSLSARARGFAIASDVMTGGALVAGGVTLYFALRPAPKHAPSAGLTVRIGADELVVLGRF